MCLGLPMRVLESDGVSALVERRGQQRSVSLLLVGEVKPGTAVLVLGRDALRILDEAEVPLIDDALDALAKALAGEPIDGHFNDLERAGHELPAHLRGGAA